MSPFRFGLLGASSVARRRFLPALVRSPQAVVTAVASRDVGRAAALAAAVGAEPVAGYEALLARDDVDGVYVSVPTGLHERWAHAVIRAGRHALVEKPLATGRSAVAGVLEAARARGVVVRENRMFVHHPQHEAVAALVADGAIGRPRALCAVMGIPRRAPEDVRHRADLGGGALLDVGYYTSHAALLAAGPDLVVQGASRRVDPTVGVDLAGSALLAGPEGLSVSLSWGLEHHYRTGYAWWGEHGRLVLDRAFTPSETDSPRLVLERPSGREHRELPPADQFRLSLEGFVAEATGRVPPDPAHGRRTLEGLALLDGIRAASPCPCP